MIKHVVEGDCLDVLRELPSEYVDLIYLDPPFGIGKDFRDFNDEWDKRPDGKISSDGITILFYKGIYHLFETLKAMQDYQMVNYLAFIAIRLIECKRVLRGTGSIYFHCDDHSVHYLKVLMDVIFGKDKFKNDITWQRVKLRRDGSGYSRIADNLLFYGEPINRDAIKVTLSKEDHIKYKHEDERGKYRAVDMKEYVDPYGIESNNYYDFHGHLGPWKASHRKMMELEKDGRIHLPKKEGGVPQLKSYLHEHKGLTPNTIWTDIKGVRGYEKMDYKTQKPVALLKRIILASSEEDDLILDPFCGSGTSLVAAQSLDRMYIGIDINPRAVEISKRRLGNG